MPTILAIGLDPAVVDYTQMPGLTAASVGAFIDAQLARLVAGGYEVENCLVDLGATAEAVTLACLRKRNYDCVLIGAGLRTEPQLLLFEKLLNLVHAHAPGAKLCFNTSPADSLEAVRRWA